MILIVLTGANRGLGFALLNQLISLKNDDVHIMAIGRKKPDVFANNKFHWFETDLSVIPFPKAELDHRLKDLNPEKVVFINNAGTIDPIGKTDSLLIGDINQSVAVNVIAPVSIVNSILTVYGNSVHKTFINVSSGAAFKAIKGWAAYCSAKAYTHSFFNCLKVDMEESRMEVYQIDPGAMDTGMQKKIRDSEIESDTSVKLTELHAAGKLKTSSLVATELLQRHLSWLL